MWAELAAATADWSPMTWAAALGGTGAALGAFANAHRSRFESQARRAQDAAVVARAQADIMKAHLAQIEGKVGKLNESARRQVVGVTKTGKAFTAAVGTDNQLVLDPVPGYIQDWCAGCNHVRGRKQMRWSKDGAVWVCRWCATGEVPPEGWCNCPDCQVFGQNAAHLPAHDVHLGPLAQAVVESTAADSPTPTQRLQEVLAQTAGFGPTKTYTTVSDARTALRNQGGGTIRRVEHAHGVIGYEVHQLGVEGPVRCSCPPDPMGFDCQHQEAAELARLAQIPPADVGWTQPWTEDTQR